MTTMGRMTGAVAPDETRAGAGGAPDEPGDPPDPARPATGYLPTLDGWRAAAILGVLAAHAVPWDSPWRRLTVHGGQGVDVFFALSGLLITTRLLEERRADKEGVRGLTGFKRWGLGGFYIRRFLRILPPAWAYLGVLMLAGWAGVIPVPSGVLPSLELRRNYTAAHGDWYTAHFWSLCVEEHFYLLWPPLLALLGPRWGAVAALAGCGGVAARRHLLGASSGALFGQTDLRADALLWGSLMALALAGPRVGGRLRRAAAWRGTLPALLVAQLAGAAWEPRGYAVMRAMLWPAILACTLLRPAGLAGRLLEWPPLKRLGRMSYSLYLWQEPFLVGSDPSPAHAWQRWPVNLALAIVVAWIMHRLVERPAAHWGHRLAPPVGAGRDSPTPAPPTTAALKMCSTSRETW